jgi:hypothetical protein
MIDVFLAVNYFACARAGAGVGDLSQMGEWAEYLTAERTF